MAGGVVGEASIVIGADASDLPGDIGKKATKSLAGVGKKLGQTLGAGINVGAKLTGAAVATTIGTSLAKGFNRLRNLDEANKRLQGLKLSAQDIDAVMVSVDNAVTGTRFSLDAAARAAAMFSTAGVDAGKAMDTALQSTVAAASAAGAPLEQIAPIFQKAASAGRVMGSELMQLEKNGVPATSALSKSLGLTAEEVRKLASQGKISFDDLNTAMITQLGDLSSTMSMTFDGMRDNILSNLGRVGAAAQKPLFNALMAVMPGLVEMMRNLARAVTEFMAPFADRFVPAAEALGERLAAIDFTGLLNGVSSFTDMLGPLLPLLGLLVGAMGPLLSSLPVLGPLFAGLTGPVGLLAGGLVALLAVKPETLVKGFDALARNLPKIIERIVGRVVDLVPRIVRQLAKSIPIFVKGLIKVLLAVIPAIAKVLPQIVDMVATLIPEILTALVGGIPSLLTAATKLFDSLIQAVVTIIPRVITTLVGLIPKVITAIVGALPQVINGAIRLFLGLLTGLLQALPQIIVAVVAAIPQIIGAIIGAIPEMIRGGIELFLGLVLALAKAIPEILGAVVGLVPTIVTSLIGMLPEMIQGGLDLFMGLVESVPLIITDLLAAVDELLPEITSSLINMGPDLIDAGIDLFLGLIDSLDTTIPQIATAIGESWPKIEAALRELGPKLVEAGVVLFLKLRDSIDEAFPKIITKMTQAGYRAITTFRDDIIPRMVTAGVDMVLGLSKGITDSVEIVKQALVRLATQAAGAFMSAMGINSPSKLFASFGKFIGDGLVVGLTGSQANVTRAVTSLVGQTDKLFDGLKRQRESALKTLGSQQQRLERATTDHNTKIGRLEERYRNARTAKQRAAIAQQIADEKKKHARLSGDLRTSIAEQRRIIDQANKGLSQRSAVNKLTRDANRGLSLIARQRDNIAKQIEEATKRLVDATAIRDNFRTSIREGVTSLFDITALDDAGQTTAQSMIDRLKQQVAATAAFRKTIERLTKLGLDDSSVAELTENFARTGSSTAAEALLAGGKDAVSEVARLRAMLEKQGDALGNSVSKTLYQAGVDAAQGIIDGLKKKDADLKKAADKIADDLVAAIKKKLGIKSPSIVLDKIGQQTMQGYIRGVSKLATTANNTLTSAIRGQTISTTRVPGQSTMSASSTGAAATRQVVINDGGAMVKVEGTSRADVPRLAQEAADRTAEKVVMAL